MLCTIQQYKLTVQLYDSKLQNAQAIYAKYVTSITFRCLSCNEQLYR
jgi:hypothetical protein